MAENGEPVPTPYPYADAPAFPTKVGPVAANKAGAGPSVSGSGWSSAISPLFCRPSNSWRRPGQTCCSNTARARSQTLLPWFGPLVLNLSALIGVAQEPSERQPFRAGTSSSSAVP